MSRGRCCLDRSLPRVERLSIPSPSALAPTQRSEVEGLIPPIVDPPTDRERLVHTLDRFTPAACSHRHEGGFEHHELEAPQISSPSARCLHPSRGLLHRREIAELDGDLLLGVHRYRQGGFTGERSSERQRALPKRRGTVEPDLVRLDDR